MGSALLTKPALSYQELSLLPIAEPQAEGLLAFCPQSLHYLYSIISINFNMCFGEDVGLTIVVDRLAGLTQRVISVFVVVDLLICDHAGWERDT